MLTYTDKGTLTDYLLGYDEIEAAKEYLTADEMVEYYDTLGKEKILSIDWELNDNGHDYTIKVITSDKLTDDELEALSTWCHGQNSDGLGEGFEQQDFAWFSYENDWCEDCGTAGCGCYDGEGHMISFDWEKRTPAFTLASAEAKGQIEGSDERLRPLYEALSKFGL